VERPYGAHGGRVTVIELLQTQSEIEAERIAAREPEPSTTDVEAKRRGLKTFRPAIGTRMWAIVNLSRLALVVGFLAGWEYLPKIATVRHSAVVFNPFFISSPTRIVHELAHLATGSHGSVHIWPYLGTTLKSAILGTVIGMSIGAIGGLLLSNAPTLYLIFRPFIFAVNAIPKIALIPVIIIITGPGSTASVLSSALVVTFIVFYNALEGGLSVPRHVLDNARLLGAGPGGIMFRVRLPMVFAWTFAALPNAISFGLVSTITAEILNGSPGLGRLLLISLNLGQATLTFAVVVIMAAVGLVLVGLARRVQKRLLHWWDSRELETPGS
jgi:NitT/TauT family transport system permease protein